jgi:hypothetical protein
MGVAAGTAVGTGAYFLARRSEKAALIASGALGVTTIGLAVAWRRAVARERECKARPGEPFDFLHCFGEALDAGIFQGFFTLSASATVLVLLGTGIAHVASR